MRSIKVKDCMTAQVITISPDITVVEAIDVLLRQDITAIPVVDGDSRILGILSESDCLQGTLIESYYSQGGGLVKDYMTKEVKTASPDDDIISVYQFFMTQNAFRVPVLKDDKVVGMLSPKDLMSAVLEFFERPAANQLHTDHHG
ncbi:hypothetical protein ACH42_06485 [Endozoicomonas sp. (ex Bugula neritina AB1)]|nr:hypothetical protein ACH42_06485 [Endozoicomonas sp. (ex Bugula neritina AB1)]